jgi:uncharacterized protein (AIM24 family)
VTMPTEANDSPAGMTTCPWCGAHVSSAELSCPGCGASVGRSRQVSGSGWTELPPIRDMARIRAGDSTCQIEGTYVPVADFNLAQGDSVYFAHHAVLWKDPAVEIRRMPIAGAFTRLMAGLPIIMTEAHGPGHIAFSRDEPGEMVAIPLQPGQSIDVREHLFLAATRHVAYYYVATDCWFTTGSGKEAETHYPAGQYLDRFTARDGPGLLLLHASGNVMVRDLAEGQTLLLKPAALVYKDPSVQLTLEVATTGGYGFGLGNVRLMWLHLAGPGRVAIQSAYEPQDAGRGQVTGQSARHWYRSPLNAAEIAKIKARAAAAAPGGGTVLPPPIDPRHNRLVQMASDGLAGGVVPPAVIRRMEEEAASCGLSAYDVRLIVNHVQSRGW